MILGGSRMTATKINTFLENLSSVIDTRVPFSLPKDTSFQMPPLHNFKTGYGSISAPKKVLYTTRRTEPRTNNNSIDSTQSFDDFGEFLSPERRRYVRQFWTVPIRKFVGKLD